MRELLIRRIRETAHDEDGASSLITFVLCIVPLVFVVAMILSFGQAMYGLQVATNASAAGARAASICDTAGEAQNVAHAVAQDYISKAGMGCTFASDEMTYTHWGRKGMLEYFVTVNVRTVMPMRLSAGSSGIPNQFTLRRSCPAVIEGGS